MLKTIPSTLINKLFVTRKVKNNSGKMNTMIVPVDFTEAAKRRASFALDMARKFNSKIIFSHAHNVVFKQTAVGAASTLTNSGAKGTLTQQRLKEKQLTEFVNDLDDFATLENHAVLELPRVCSMSL